MDGIKTRQRMLDLYVLMVRTRECQRPLFKLEQDRWKEEKESLLKQCRRLEERVDAMIEDIREARKGGHSDGTGRRGSDFLTLAARARECQRQFFKLEPAERPAELLRERCELEELVDAMLGEIRARGQREERLF